MDIYVLIFLGLVVALNVFYAVLTRLDLKRGAERENRLLKALIAKNLPEYQRAEASPREQLQTMKVENDLAMNAVKIEEERSKKENVIPIT